jgi:hypothetical protein
VVRGGTLWGAYLFGSPSIYGRAWRNVARGLFAEVYGGGAAPAEREACSIVQGALRDRQHDPQPHAGPGNGPNRLYVD